MKTVLHLSDLHFGRIDEPLLRPLIDAAAEAAPDLVVVSGDLTQRARQGQFLAARAFLEALPGPRLVVPGNHDIPMHNPLARFVAPLENYRGIIAADPEPSYLDDRLVVLGLSSARSLTIAEGRLSRRQLRRLVRVFDQAGAGAIKILVSHHPFDLPPGFEDRRVVRGAGRAVAAMAGSGGDVVLSGHFHTGHSSSSAVRYRGQGRAILLVQAGTATSTRRRGQQSSFNVLRIDGGAAVGGGPPASAAIDVEEHRWDGRAFAVANTARFTRGPEGWLPA